MRFFLLLLTLGLILSGCPASSDPAAAVHASENYLQKCASCHGTQGDLGLGGAKNLRVSTLDKAQIIQQIQVGKGVMPPFEGRLSESEIEQVADYVVTLRKP